MKRKRSLKSYFQIFLAASMISFFILPVQYSELCCGGQGPLDELGIRYYFQLFGGLRFVANVIQGYSLTGYAMETLVFFSLVAGAGIAMAAFGFNKIQKKFDT